MSWVEQRVGDRERVREIVITVREGPKVCPSGSFEPQPELQDASRLPGISNALFSSIKRRRRAGQQPGGEDGADAADTPHPDLPGGEPRFPLLLHLRLILKDLLPG